MRVFVDTAAFVAVRSPDDRHHVAATEAFAALVRRGAKLVSTNYTFAETYATLLRRTNRDTAIAWGSQARVSSTVEFVRIDRELDDAAWKLLKAHADRDWSFVDAVSFALIEREGIGVAFALAHHFRQRGLAVIPALD